MFTFIAELSLLLLALFLGLNLPDIDHQFGFLVHRSVITHGFLVPLGLFLVIYKEKTTIARFLAMGFNLAAITHLSFDLFPQAWRGFALIHVPFWGRTTAVFSWLWISLSIIICFYLTLILIRIWVDMVLVVGGLAVAFSFYATTEAVFWPALITVIAGGGLTLALPSDSRAMIRRLWVRRS